MIIRDNYSCYKVRIIKVREEGPLIKGPGALFPILKKRFSGLDREYFIRFDLSIKNKIIGEEVVSKGTLSSNLVHPREVFKAAIVNSAASIIVAHNHPSGDCTPSDEDTTITKRLAEVGKLLGIELLDHLIFGNGKYKSMKEEGLL